MTRIGQITVVVTFLFAISIQAILAIGGVESQSVRDQLATPRGSLGWDELLDTDGLDQFSAYLDDQLIYREGAAELTNDLDRVLLLDDSRQESKDTVVVGLDGWLFQRDSFTAFCDLTPAEAVQIASDTADLVAEVEGSGTTVLMTVAPDKRTIRPDRIELPDELACEEPSRSAFREALTTDANEWFLDLWSALEAERRAGSEVYRQRDTHWDGIGGLTLVTEVIEALRFEGNHRVVDDGTEALPGDLTRVLGVQSLDPVAQLSIDNDAREVSTDELIPERPGLIRRVQSTSPDPMVDGRTVIIIDSFGETAIDSFTQIFSDVTFVTWQSYESPAARAAVADAELLIVQSAERETPRNLSERLPVLVGLGEGS